MLAEISVLGYWLLGAFSLALVVQLYYHFVVFGKFAFYKPQPAQPHKQEPVSIIIAARNEYENLQKYLPAILNQQYPEFEVVVVNHCSWDTSQQLLEDLQLQYKHLKVSELKEQEKYPTGKKFALTIGIKAAKYDTLLFTDADCEPASDQWLALMQSRFTRGKEIVLGYSPFVKKGGFLNLYARFVSFITALFYYSSALNGRPFMGVGRNLAYTKELFFKYKGFAAHQHLMSGDDDLFVNQVANATNVAIEFTPESFMLTEAKDTFEKYVRQKTRHMTTGKYYKTEHKLMLALYYSSYFLFYGFLAASLVFSLMAWPIVAGIYGIRLICQWIVFYNASLKLKCVSILWSLPILDIAYLFYLLFFGTKSLFIRNPKVW